jgi:hypothetical protein
MRPVRGGIALLKGFSIFNPDDRAVLELKEQLGFGFDFIDDQEKIGWIGASDLRFFIVTFGAYFFPILYVVFFNAAYVKYLETRHLMNAGLWIALASFVLMTLYQIYIASHFFGVVYVVTNRRIAVSTCKKCSQLATLFSRRIFKKAGASELYYDINKIAIVTVIKIFGTSFGSLNLKSSISAIGEVDDLRGRALRSVKVRNHLTLQGVTESFSPLNIFPALHGISHLARLSDLNRGT